MRRVENADWPEAQALSHKHLGSPLIFFYFLNKKIQVGGDICPVCTVSFDRKDVVPLYPGADVVAKRSAALAGIYTQTHTDTLCKYVVYTHKHTHYMYMYFIRYIIYICIQTVIYIIYMYMYMYIYIYII